MVHIRAAKVAGIAKDIPDVVVDGPDDAEASSSSGGAPRGAPSTVPCTTLRARGRDVAKAHLIHLNPFPPNLGDVLRRFPKVLIPEMNLGQLSRLVPRGVSG